MTLIDIYLASPYSHPDPAIREQRYEQACEAAAALMRQGWTVFSPIAHSHNLVKYGLPSDWSFWKRMDSEFIQHCKMLVILALPGWDESEGVQCETKLAQELNIPIRIAPLKSLLDGELKSVADRVAALMNMSIEETQRYIDEARKLGWVIELDEDGMVVMRKEFGTTTEEQAPCKTH